MPKQNVDYSKTVIYKIVCNDLDIGDSYVGSTTNFTKRKNRHKHSCNTETSPSHELAIYKCIRSNGGWLSWSMIEVEKYPCLDGNEAHARERYWYEQLKPSLNVQVPARSHKDYNIDNYDKVMKNHKEYYNLNKEEIINYQKGYYIANKEKIKQQQRENHKRRQADKKAQSAQQST